MKRKTYSKGSHLLRKHRNSKSYNYYFITTSTHGKQPILRSKQHFDIILNSLRYLEKEERIDLHFLIMMQDHIHIVFMLGKDQVLSSIMRSFKGYTGNRIKATRNDREHMISRIWQSQYYDHLIRRDESCLDIMRYCLYNSVRKGLVDDPLDYPFWWCKHKLLD
jgi:putative transposase